MQPPIQIRLCRNAGAAPWLNLHRRRLPDVVAMEKLGHFVRPTRTVTHRVIARPESLRR
jgi:hypothetical protein